MPVTLNAVPEHSFAEPLGLLSDCHRRIERFLEVLIRVAEDGQGREVTVQQREALEAALRYFRVAAPRHTEDEERSLFPRLRQSPDPRVKAALEKVAALEVEHEKAARGHAEVEHWCRRWLDVGPLAPPEVRRLVSVLETLRATYREHIRFEDTELFPLAGEVLSAEAIAAIGQEMAERRGVAPVHTI